jgi:dienelactone hydrolase
MSYPQEKLSIMKQKVYFLLLYFAVVFPSCGANSYVPPGKGPFPAVILLHSQAGLTNEVLQFASDLSREGYVAWPLHYLSGGRGDGFRREVINKELSIIAAAYDELKAYPNVDPNRIAMVGFSRGTNWTAP